MPNKLDDLNLEFFTKYKELYNVIDEVVDGRHRVKLRSRLNRLMKAHQKIINEMVSSPKAEKYLK